MKKLLSLALILALVATMTTSVFAANVVGTHGNGNINDGVSAGAFNSQNPNVNIDIKVTAGEVQSRYAVDVTYETMALTISASNLVWDVNNLEYVSAGTGEAMTNTTFDVKVTNYSDLPVYVTATISDLKTGTDDDGVTIETVNDSDAATTYNKAEIAGAAASHQAQVLDFGVKVSSTNWVAVANKYAPLVTGGGSVTIATCTITIDKTNS